MCQYAIVHFKAIGLTTLNGSNLLFEKYFGEIDVGLGVVLTNKKPKIGKGTTRGYWKKTTSAPKGTWSVAT
jgi:hypothetical protein